MKIKEYEMPDGRKAVFEYDENGVGKITLECMDMLMRLINDRKTEPQTDFEKYLDKIRPHDPHKDWFEDDPRIDAETKWLKNEGEF